MEAGEGALLIGDEGNVDDEYKAPVTRMLPQPPDRHQSLANFSYL